VFAVGFVGGARGALLANNGGLAVGTLAGKPTEQFVCAEFCRPIANRSANSSGPASHDNTIANPSRRALSG